MRGEDWFLTEGERGNPATELHGWSEGNVVRPLVHGASYFARLVDEVRALREGDLLFFTDWRGERCARRAPRSPSCSATRRAAGSW